MHALKFAKLMKALHANAEPKSIHPYEAAKLLLQWQPVQIKP